MRRKVGRIGTTIGRQTRARRARGLPKPDNGSGRPFRVAPEPPPEGAARRAVVRPALALVKGVWWCWGGQAGRAGVSPPRRLAWGLFGWEGFLNKFVNPFLSAGKLGWIRVCWHLLGQKSGIGGGFSGNWGSFSGVIHMGHIDIDVPFVYKRTLAFKVLVSPRNVPNHGPQRS